MPTLPKCPKCDADYTYLDGVLFVCPSCSHEWNSTDASAPAASDDAETTPEDTAVRDANGNILQTGDSVIVIKDLKVKGSSLVVKGGTKVKNIRLVDGDHNIDCKIDGIGAMSLKSEFVKKA
jgi:protein PhnA